MSANDGRRDDDEPGAWELRGADREVPRRPRRGQLMQRVVAGLAILGLVGGTVLGALVWFVRGESAADVARDYLELLRDGDCEAVSLLTQEVRGLSGLSVAACEADTARDYLRALPGPPLEGCRIAVGDVERLRVENELAPDDPRRAVPYALAGCDSGTGDDVVVMVEGAGGWRVSDVFTGYDAYYDE
ncbi:hypothetical protein [Nocardioides sp. R-C-SC26]|uniref:hypothetical protein n=1 Tax=Nocardioides sp. R-C-SC26 TaxID=2870414 RepID=UPI001E4ABCD9|nr:hypothetical protein [Nocardioides sp. R-C-SC26]